MMPRYRLFLSCLLSVFLLLTGPVASAWALEGSVSLAPIQGVDTSNGVDACADTPASDATTDLQSLLDDVPAGDPPFAFHTALPAAPHLRQVMNAAALPTPATTPQAPLHKPPSA